MWTAYLMPSPNLKREKHNGLDYIEGQSSVCPYKRKFSNSGGPTRAKGRS